MNIYTHTIFHINVSLQNAQKSFCVDTHTVHLLTSITCALPEAKFVSGSLSFVIFLPSFAD